ncbi:lytic murein transglycosylase B [Teredinibacter haidensis]|mgnify:CR=1 FL=1|uniref:lytic murein transglycosylase B n=1 Tax=Teredinibacter haidensis TaxID=2731755 RepID=UPI000948FDAA|nr:lytic murein transglycosylase B [Teredinibacter haidensis]
MSVKLFRSLVVVISLVSAVSLPVSADYSTHPKAESFIHRMVNEHGFDAVEVKAWLAAAEKKQSILDAISRPAEKTKPWKDYRKIFLGQDRIDQGVQFWNDNRETLRRASEQLGVDEQVIVAIIGVETRYGRHTGKFRVIDALATLGFDYEPRAKFFGKELEHFLLLAREQKQDPLSLKGSYAGAMGYGQFIPSSYRSYAIDFDGDKVADIWNNPVDAIGSVANYFKVHRWEKGEIVFSRARIKSEYDKSVLNERVRPHYSLNDVADLGFTPINTQLSGAEKVVPLVYEGSHGKEFWLGFDNYYVITRYNRSQLYAMAVWQLSEELRYAYERQLH